MLVASFQNRLCLDETICPRAVYLLKIYIYFNFTPPDNEMLLKLRVTWVIQYASGSFICGLKKDGGVANKIVASGPWKIFSWGRSRQRLSSQGSKQSGVISSCTADRWMFSAGAASLPSCSQGNAPTRYLQENIKSHLIFNISANNFMESRRVCVCTYQTYIT